MSRLLPSAAIPPFGYGVLGIPWAVIVVLLHDGPARTAVFAALAALAHFAMLAATLRLRTASALRSRGAVAGAFILPVALLVAAYSGPGPVTFGVVVPLLIYAHLAWSVIKQARSGDF